MKKIIPSEHDEQVVLVKILRTKYPGLLFWATPNGGLRNMIVAKKLKAEGVRSGVPDLFFPGLRLFIEMKRQSDYHISDSQEYIMSLLKKMGYRVELCRGCDAALVVIESCIIDQNNK